MSPMSNSEARKREMAHPALSAPEFDPALVEQAARALYDRPPGHVVPWQEVPHWVRALYTDDALAVLTAAAPTLRAEGAEKAGWRERALILAAHRDDAQIERDEALAERDKWERVAVEATAARDQQQEAKDKARAELARVKADARTACQRGKVGGAREVRAGSENVALDATFLSDKESAAFWRGHEETLAAASEAVARIEKGADS